MDTPARLEAPAPVIADHAGVLNEARLLHRADVMGLAAADADRPPTAAATSKMVLSCVMVFSV